MATDFEHGGLKWVIDEIYETLKQARVHFESFVEDEEDNSQLQFCTTYLHQVAGSLNMLELGGATLLAEEMELLSQAIYDDNVARREDSFEVLMRALIQLPDYLERLDRGARDLPMVLLPLLNDLRATRGEKLLTEGAVFSANITLDNITPEPDNGIDPSQLAKKIRHHYHLGLLGWYRDSESLASINKVKKVVFKLKESVKTPIFFQLFSLMEAFIEGLMDRSIDSSASTKLLLGQADRYIKQLIDKGESIDAYTNNDEQELQSLKKNLLFYIAHSDSSNGLEDSAINTIKSFYNLAEVVPDEDEIEDARASMGGANADLMETVTGVILGDLANVKEQLDVFVRNVSESTETSGSILAEESEHKESLDVIITTMTQISDTLAMLGQNAPRGVLQEKIEQLKSMLDNGQLLERTALMDIASALLYVESAVSEMGQGGLFTHSDEDENIDLTKIDMTEQEKNVLLRDLIDEAKKELLKAKEGIVSLIDTFANDVQNPEQNEQSINIVHNSLQSLGGVLDILEKEQGSQIVKDCANFIINSMIIDDVLAPEEQQQHLADTITALEYYLDAIAENQQDLSIIESVAQSGIDQLLGRESDAASYESELSKTLAVWMEDVSVATSRENLLKAVISVAEQVKLLQNDKAEEIAHQMKSMISLVGDKQDSLSDDISSTLRWATETINRIICNATELKESSIVDNEKKTVEESKSLTSEEPKESGAENEIQSDTLLATEEENITVEEAIDEEEFLTKQDVLPDSNDDISLISPQDEPAITITQPIIDDPAKDYPDIKKLETSDDVDPEIMEIFIEEAQEEIEKISTLFPQWKSEQDSMEALTEMRRSFHTLKGSGRLVGAYEMGEFSWAFENMINRIIDATISA
ncbi:MAG: Hpt domain-containing protein, partial [Gammaproteobacteria bacterium]|nr:Hpt domain-containing protein [Gammaproteobacteria bacterium]